jgi:hypothetical protein
MRGSALRAPAGGSPPHPPRGLAGAFRPVHPDQEEGLAPSPGRRLSVSPKERSSRATSSKRESESVSNMYSARASRLRRSTHRLMADGVEPGRRNYETRAAYCDLDRLLPLPTALSVKLSPLDPSDGP